MCSNKHFQYIANGLYTQALYIGEELNDKDYVQELVNSWQKINIEALKQRYEDRVEQIYSFSNRVEKPSLDDIDTHQLLKALHCLRYQCSEGNVPEREEYQSLSKYIDIITNKLVMESDDYANADWEII